MAIYLQANNVHFLRLHADQATEASGVSTALSRRESANGCGSSGHGGDVFTSRSQVRSWCFSRRQGLFLGFHEVVSLMGPRRTLNGFGGRKAESLDRSSGNVADGHFQQRPEALAEAQLDLGGDEGGDDGGSGNGPGRGGPGDDGSSSDRGDQDSGEGQGDLGSILSAAAVGKVAAEKGVIIPVDMMQYAEQNGLSSVLLQRYCDLEGAYWPLGPLMRTFGALRDRMLADPSFLFKLGTEIVIDSVCATAAEVKQRGKDFWKEIDFVISDLVVGIVMDVALVSMLAPAARFGLSTTAAGWLPKTLAALPSSMFEVALPGRQFSGPQRLATLFVKGVEYGVVGFGCGLVGQFVTNSIVAIRREIQNNDPEGGPKQGMLPTAVLWGVFMALSSNVRYQGVNGLETLVESSPITKQIPQLALAFTVAVRFGNNYFGGMQFIDWARRSGVQGHDSVE